MKAMILAAGRGERMRHLTANTPKPLLLVAGKPLIVWHIENLVQCGIKDIVINLAYLGEQISFFLGDGKKFSANIQYSYENEGALESAGGIKNAFPLLVDQDNSAFIVINADIFTDWKFNFHDFYAWSKSNYLAHLFLVNNPNHNLNGDFSIKNNLSNNQSNFLNLSNYGEKSYTYSGISYFKPDFFSNINIAQVVKLAPLLRTAIDNSLVSGELYNGVWIDVGAPERLTQATDLANLIFNAKL